MSLEPDDAICIERCRAGDAAAFDRLVLRHAGWATRFAARMLGGVEAAEDAVQDAFVRVLRAIDDFRGAATFRTYLYRVLVNRCRDAAASRRREAALLEGAAARAAVREGVAPPHRGAERRELGEAIAKSLERLPRAQRETLVLRVYEDLSYREIAEILGVTVHAVKWNLAAARDRMAEQLGPDVRGEVARGDRAGSVTPSRAPVEEECER